VSHRYPPFSSLSSIRQAEEAPNDGLQLRRAISVQGEGTNVLEKHAIAPSAARLCLATDNHTSRDKSVAQKETTLPLLIQNDFEATSPTLISCQVPLSRCALE
jgi:hypothetical protein